MAKVATKKQREMSPALFWALLLLLAGLAVFVRFYDLSSDPPNMFAHGSQDLTTDGAYLTLHAKQAVLYGQWDLFGYHHWTPFKVSLVSGASYLLFQAFGVSTAVANATGAVLSLGGLFLLMAALWDRSRKRFLLLLALFLATNLMMSVYGRTPFSENGLIFLAGLTFFVFSRWSDKLWGLALVGILVALCGLLGKSFGFLLIAGPIWYVFAQKGDGVVRKLAVVAIPFAVTFAIFWVVFYSEQGFFTFLWEHGTGVHGFPHGFESPKGFVECLIAFGRYGLQSQSAIVSVLTCLALMTLVLDTRGSVRSDKTTIFMTSWLVTTAVALAPFNYLPLRYLYPLFLPMAVLASLWLERLETIDIEKVTRLAWWRISLLVILLWLAAYYASIAIFVSSRDLRDHLAAVWWTFPIGLALFGILWVVLRAKRITFSPAVARVIVGLVVVGTLAVEGYHHVTWLGERMYTLRYANVEVSNVIGADAVVAGQFAPAITMDSRIRTFPMFVTEDLSFMEPLLRQYPITHLAVGEQAWEQLVTDLPVLKKALSVTRFWARDNVVVIAQVAGLFGNPEAMKYQPTDYEKSVRFMFGRQADSLEYYLKKSLAAHPTSRAALADAYYLTVESAPLTVQKPTVDRLLANYPTDFAVNQLGAIYYRSLFQLTKNQNDLDRSRELVENAVRLNPENEAKIRHDYQLKGPNEPII